jgi:hypothetical protein
MPTLTRTLGPVPRALVLAVASLVAPPIPAAFAEEGPASEESLRRELAAFDRPRPEQAPERPFAHVHLDVYHFYYVGADLGSVPVHTSVGTLKGRDIGVTGVEVVGLPLVGPCLGFGVEVPYTLFYVHGGVSWMGRGTGQVTGIDDALIAFGQLTVAPRLSLGMFVLSLGPSVGLRYLEGSQAGGWDTGARPTLGGELDARLRNLTNRGSRYHHHAPNMTSDVFIHFTANDHVPAQALRSSFSGALGVSQSRA